MNGWDILVIVAILGIFFLAGYAIYRSGKKGKGCIGCPDNCACSRGNCNGGCTGCGK